jgi:hypothetical protein
MAQFPKSVEVMVKTIPSIAAVVQPGDTLVVGMANTRPMTDREFSDMKEYLERELPGVKILICPASSMVVYRP